jgi:phytoene dehydrogenase-like protein
MRASLRAPAARSPAAAAAARRRAAAAAAAAAAATPRAATAAAAAPNPDAIVVGAGVAGLAAAARLAATGRSVALLEAADAAGGRVRTDALDGFLLDRGFQIFLTSYPEAAKELDLAALDLKPFYAGAQVRWNGGFHVVADPLRHPLDALATLAPAHAVGSPLDKLRVGLLRAKCLLGSVDSLLAAPETSIAVALKEEGFSEEMVDRFFRPFLGGIFFDRSLGTTSRMLRFVMRMLATGQNCLPAAGIGAVAAQLEARLPPGALRLNARVESVERAGADGLARVALAGGGALAARAVVVATECPAAAALLGDALSNTSAAAAPAASPAVGTCCLYFAAPRAPRPGAFLYLNGEGDADGPVNNACFPSEVSASYAPPGATLVSLSVIGARPDLDDAALEGAARAQMGRWFGAGEVSAWRHLRTYRIPFAQPGQAPPTAFARPPALGGGLYVAGDHRAGATLDGALRSGREAAEAALAAGL